MRHGNLWQLRERDRAGSLRGAVAKKLPGVIMVCGEIPHVAECGAEGCR
jgi:hypothetical protein